MCIEVTIEEMIEVEEIDTLTEDEIEADREIGDDLDPEIEDETDLDLDLEIEDGTGLDLDPETEEEDKFTS